ncbi:MAG: hypothetical protein R6U86_03965 [Bacteroidales bacterium]
MTTEIFKSTILNRVEKYGALIALFLLTYRVFFGIALDVFLLNAITLLAIYYLWLGFFLFNKTLPLDLVDRRKRVRFTPFRTVSSILMGLVYSVCLIAILYAVFFYPRMQFMLGFAFFLLGASLASTLVYHWLNKADWHFLSQFYRRTAILGVFILGTIITPVETRLGILYSNYPGFVEAYKEYRTNPDSPEALERLRSERSNFR